MAEHTVNFRVWLKRHLDSVKPIGTFARLVEKHARDCWNYGSIRDALRGNSAEIEMLEAAYGEYVEYINLKWKERKND